MRLGTDAKHAQIRVATRIDALFLHHLVDARGIRRNGVEHGRSEVLDELDLSGRVAGGGRHGEHSDALGTVLETESGGEHSVASRVLENVFGTASHHPQASRHGGRPFVEVFLRVQHDGWVARRSARRVQSRTFAHRYAGEAKRIVVAQVFLRGEGQSAHVVQRFDVVGRDAEFSEFLTVKFRVHTVAHGLLQPFQLKFFQFFSGHRFNFWVEKITVVCHILIHFIVFCPKNLV